MLRKGAFFPSANPNEEHMELSSVNYFYKSIFLSRLQKSAKIQIWSKLSMGTKTVNNPPRLQLTNQRWKESITLVFMGKVDWININIWATAHLPLR